jgi:putative protease
MIELLAPVGSREALVAAVESGADAVYLAGKMFGARASAPNFSDEELAEAVRFAHLRSVLVYVTVNTLVDNIEIPALTVYLQYLYKIGVDAIIVQDIGVFQIARQIVPDMPIHASTQMTVHNLEGVEFLTELGFERVVVSRELSMEDLNHICKNTKTEIEAFVHGALCISYSGQCLMSSMIGGRSGNRGRCAQPCRLPYTLVDERGNDLLTEAEAGEYLLSPKDLNTLELIPELIHAGVTSFKIEGRMKRPEYVAVAVDTYRRAIDAYLANPDNYAVAEQEQKELAQIFNRDFTTAYLKKNHGRNMMSDRRPNNRGVRIGRVSDYDFQERIATIKLDEPLYINDIVDFWVKVGGRVSVTVSSMTVNNQAVAFAPAGAEVSIPLHTHVRMNDRVFKVFDAGLMQRARAFFTEPNAIKRVSVAIKVTVCEGQPMEISIQDEDGFTGRAVTNFIAEKALKRPLTLEVIQKQVDRLGSTIFSLDTLDCEIQGEVMVPMSEINDARRRAVEELEKARLAPFYRKDLPRKKYVIRDFIPSANVSPNHNHRVERPLLVTNVDTIAKLTASFQNGGDLVMFGGESFNHKVISKDEYKQAVSIAREQGKKIILNTPRIIKTWQTEELKRELALFAELQPDGIGISNLGALHMAKQLTNIPLHGDYPLNVYNDVSIAFFAKQGMSSITLSPELNFSQIEELGNNQNVSLECIVHGYLTLMVSEYCTIGSYLGNVGAGNCNQACTRKEYWLNDRKDENFPIATDQFCRMHILNAKELSMLPHVSRFGTMGIERIRIEGKKSNVDYLSRIVKLYRELLDQGENHPLIVEDKIKSVEHEEITRGHYFRGVL